MTLQIRMNEFILIEQVLAARSPALASKYVLFLNSLDAAKDQVM